MKFTASQDGYSVTWDDDKWSGDDSLVPVLRTMAETYRFPTMGSDPALNALAAIMALMSRAEFSGDVPKLPSIDEGAVA